MNLRRMTATAVLVVSAIGLGSATAYADPAPASNDIGYQMKVVEQSIVTTLDKGRFEVKKDSYEIEDSSGKAVVELPLSVNLGDIKIPLHAVMKDDKTLQLTPEVPKQAITATSNLMVKPVASLEENQKAQSAFLTQLGIATSVGGLVGTIIGAVVGCVFGLPLFGVGCIPGIAAGAGLGGVIGTIVAGGPTLVVAGIDLIQTLQAPPGTTTPARADRQSVPMTLVIRQTTAPAPFQTKPQQGETA